MSLLRKEIAKIATQVVSDYSFPSWAIVDEYDSKIGRAVIRVNEQDKSAFMKIHGVPVAIGGKSFKDSDIRKGDMVQIAYHEGKLDEPVIIAVIDKEKLNRYDTVPRLYGVM